MTGENPDGRGIGSHGDFVRMQQQAARRDIGAELHGRHRGRVRRRWMLAGLLLALALIGGLAVFLTA